MSDDNDHQGEETQQAGDLGVYEMLWDCRYCGRPRNLGKTHRHCPGCGAAQDPSWVYFPAEGEGVAVADHEYVGADLMCAHCQAPMSAKARNCGNCGAPLDGGKQVRARESQYVAEGQHFAGETIADAKRERAPKAAPPPPPPPRSRWPLAIYIALGVALVGGIAWYATRKHDAGVVITGHAWQREVRIDRFGPQPGSAWCDALPFGAITVSRAREERSTHEVPDGQECGTRRVDRGDGTFKMQRECKPKFRREPVYDEKCSYLLNAWQYARSATARGTGTAPAPSWPEVSLRAGTCLGCEREAGRTETLELQFLDEKTKESGKCKVDTNHWSQVSDSSRWIVRLGSTGADCDDMKQAP